MTKCKYYIVETAENKEFYVKNKITTLFPEIKVIIPIEKNKIKINGYDFAYFNRLTPDYVVLQCEVLSDKCYERLSEMDGVVSVISEKTSTGKNVASEVSEEEAQRLLSSFDRKQILSNNKEISVIAGQYAGYTGKIIKEYDDDVLVSINSKKKLRVRIPIWHIGKEVKGGI